MAFRILTNRNLSLSDLRNIVAGQRGELNSLMLCEEPTKNCVIYKRNFTEFVRFVVLVVT
jgi:hypothetical protein